MADAREGGLRAFGFNATGSGVGVGLGVSNCVDAICATDCET